MGPASRRSRLSSPLRSDGRPNCTPPVSPRAHRRAWIWSDAAPPPSRRTPNPVTKPKIRVSRGTDLAPGRMAGLVGEPQARSVRSRRSEQFGSAASPNPSSVRRRQPSEPLGSKDLTQAHAPALGPLIPSDDLTYTLSITTGAQKPARAREWADISRSRALRRVFLRRANRGERARPLGD